MNETRWTPGPWAVNPRARTCVEAPAINRGVAACGQWNDGRLDQGEIQAEQQANARLIAAAPDLYYALDYAAAHIEAELGPDHVAAVNAREQLAKARGES